GAGERRRPVNGFPRRARRRGTPGRARGDRRCRLRRPRRRDPAAGGGDRRRAHPRARRRARRNLAGEHVPRCRLRRAEPALLVLLRAQPRLDPVLRAAGRDPRVPPPDGAGARPGGVHPLRRRPALRPLGPSPAALAHRDRRRPGHRGGARGRRRAAERAERPGRSGPGQLHGDGVPLRPVAPRPRSHRPAGRGDRHGRLGGAVRPARARKGCPHRRLPAHPGLDPPAARSRDRPADPGALPPPPRRAAPRAQRDLLHRRAARRRARARQARAVALRGDRADQAAPRRQGSHVAQQADAELPHRLQAHHLLRRLPAGAGLTGRRAGHRRDRANRAGRDPHRRRQLPPRRHDHPRHGLQGVRLAGRAPDRRHGRSLAGRGVGTGRSTGLRGDGHRRLPEPLLSHRPEHRAREQLDDQHHRGPGRVRRACAARDGGRRGRCDRRAPRGPGGVQRRAAGAHGRHGVDRRRLPVVVPHRRRHEPHAVAELLRRVQAPAAALRPRRLPHGAGSPL
ncbi:MAG: Cyclohexanone monooxygenase, partial [uncultured Solirubrobacteraceae bacterium]